MNMGKHLSSLFVCLLPACLIAETPISADTDNTIKSNLISKKLIQDLEKDLAATLDLESTIQRRRAYKNIVRSSLSLIDRHPDAPNRFAVLGIVFQCQKELLVLKNDRRNQEAIIKTCNQLLKASDEYAVLRFEAETLLSQWELESTGATEYERALSIAELADKYRDTAAELDSLIVAAEIAFNLGHAELLKEFRHTLSTKFNNHSKAIGFLKDRFAFKSSSLMFRGHFKREDGESLVLPIDRAGHVYLSCFWSTQIHDIKDRLMAIKDLQKKYPGRFEVLSFNLDELPDAGKNYLESLDLDFRPLHLPGGRNNKLFRSFSSNPEFLIRITSANGYIILTPIGSTYRTYGRVTDLEEYLIITMEKDRFLSLMQTARIGDFFILDPFRPFDANSPPELHPDSKESDKTSEAKLNRGENSVPADALKSIQDCFTAPPMRYRLTKQQALENYKRAAKLCDDAIKQYAKSENLWVVYSRRIIALLGIWNLSAEPEYLTEAVKAANTVLAMNIPRQARIAAKFCLVKDALRQEGSDPEALISDFVKDTGGPKASALSIAAAAVLSLDAGSPVLFARYRDALLNEHMSDPKVWSLTAYFFDKFVTGRLFRGNYYASDVRHRDGFREWQKTTETRPRKFMMKLNNLKGETINFPHSDNDKSNVVVFMEPPADEACANVQIDLVKRLDALAKTHIHKNLNFVIAFLSDDIEGIDALVQKNNWDAAQVALVPDGLKNPHVLRLGIFLVDQRPNTFMVAHDGIIIWSISGMYHLATSTNAVAGTVKEMTQRHDLSVGNTALQKGDFERALRIFEGSFPPDPRKFQYLKNAQLIGRSKAYKGLKNFKDALQGYDNIVETHLKNSSRRYCICHSLSIKLLLRAEILENLGKKDEAEADRLAAKHLACPPDKPRIFDPGRDEWTIYNKFRSFKARKNWQEAFDYINDIIVNNKDGKQAQRNEYAAVLHERAEILEHLGQSEQAKKDRLRAEALTEHVKSSTITSQPQDQHKILRYVDIVINAQ